MLIIVSFISLSELLINQTFHSSICELFFFLNYGIRVYVSLTRDDEIMKILRSTLTVDIVGAKCFSYGRKITKNSVKKIETEINER